MDINVYTRFMQHDLELEAIQSVPKPHRSLHVMITNARGGYHNSAHRIDTKWYL